MFKRFQAVGAVEKFKTFQQNFEHEKSFEFKALRRISTFGSAYYYNY